MQNYKNIFTIKKIISDIFAYTKQNVILLGYRKSFFSRNIQNYGTYLVFIDKKYTIILL